MKRLIMERLSRSALAFVALVAASRAPDQNSTLLVLDAKLRLAMM
jgi:hypothetical protein